MGLSGLRKTFEKNWKNDCLGYIALDVPRLNIEENARGLDPEYYETISVNPVVSRQYGKNFEED